MALSIAAAIYVGFAVAGGAQAQWFLVEAAGFALFSVLAIISVKDFLWVLALGWFVHILWDIMLHSHTTGFVPEWYPPLCIGFDFVASAHVWFLYRLKGAA